MATVRERFCNLETVQFSSGDVHVLFVPETLQLFRLSGAAAAAVAAVRGGGSPPEALEPFLARVVDAVGAAAPAWRPRRDVAAEAVLGLVLPKLVLMVNNFCNLRCTYCYELATVFRQRAKVMASETVDAALEGVFSAFTGCAELMFIGGEPSLSAEVIDYACERAADLAHRRRVPIAFSMITNGVRMTEHLFEVIDRYDMQVTFSVDGPQPVHDAARVHRDGAGSYGEVLHNIGRYRGKRAAKLGVECTLTELHAEHGVTVSDLSRFFAEEVGVSAPHVAAAGLAAGDPLATSREEPTRLEREFTAAAAGAMDALLAALASPGDAAAPRPGLDLVSGMVRTLIRRRSAVEMCPAGTSQLVVDAHGDVYPCWMFAGMADFRMGNVTRDPLFNDLARKVLKRILDNDKRRNPQCRTCSARTVCNVCLGNNHNGTGRIETIDESYCRTIRAVLETVLVKLGEAQADAERWAAIRGAATRSAELRRDASPC